MNLPIEFYQIQNSADPGFTECIKIYHDSFPVYERQSDEVITGRVDDGRCCLLAGKAKGKIVCMALVWKFPDTPYVFLDYFAVGDEARGYGVGTRFLLYIISEFITVGNFLVMEVEHPDYGLNQEDRMRRVKFYENNGGVILNNVRYFLPPLGGSSTPMAMQLMLIPDPTAILHKEAIQKLIGLIYTKVYQKKYETPI